MKDSLLYLSVLLALRAIITTFSLFKNDNYDEDGGQGDNLAFPALIL